MNQVYLSKTSRKTVVKVWVLPFSSVIPFIWVLPFIVSYRFGSIWVGFWFISGLSSIYLMFDLSGLSGRLRWDPASKMDENYKLLISNDEIRLIAAAEGGIWNCLETLGLPRFHLHIFNIWLASDWISGQAILSTSYNSVITKRSLPSEYLRWASLYL